MTRRLASSGGALAVFLVFTILVAAHWTPLTIVDNRLVTAAYRITFEHPWLRTSSIVVSAIGSPLAVDLVAGIAVTIFLVVGRIDAVIVVVIARLGELGVESLVKLLVNRPRPVFGLPLSFATGSSFPSGHAAGSAALYVVLVLLCAPMLTRWPTVLVMTVATLFVLAVGTSRVLLGLHYPSDVVAGFALGLAWAIARLGSSVRDRSPDP